MTTADAQAIAVSTYGEDNEFWICQLNSRCHRQGPAMDRVEAEGICEKGVTTCTTDPGDRNDLMMR
jgi:hypothetical protein